MISQKKMISQKMIPPKKKFFPRNDLPKKWSSQQKDLTKAMISPPNKWSPQKHMISQKNIWSPQKWSPSKQDLPKNDPQKTYDLLQIEKRYSPNGKEFFQK